MAAGDEWRKVDAYHVRLYRKGEATSYTICAVRVRGQLIYELWTGEAKKPPVCLARDGSAAPLKELVPVQE